MNSILSLFSCCGSRNHDYEVRSITTHGVEKEYSKCPFLKNFEVDELEMSVDRQAYESYIKKVDSKMSTGALKESRLNQILKVCYINCKKIKELLNTDFFTINRIRTTKDVRMVDLYKTILFLMIYSKLDKYNKIEIVVELTILLAHGKECYNRPSFFISSEFKDEEELSCDIIIFVISLLMSSPVIPFLYNYENFNLYEDFNEFRRYCLNKEGLFERIAKINLNRFFLEFAENPDDQRPYSKVKKDLNLSSLSTKSVKASHLREFLINNYSSFFIPTIIRENLVKYWENERDNVTESETTSQAFEMVTPGNPDLRKSISEKLIVELDTKPKPELTPRRNKKPKVRDSNNLEIIEYEAKEQNDQKFDKEAKQSSYKFVGSGK